MRVIDSEIARAGGGRTEEAWLVEANVAPARILYSVGKVSHELLEQRTALAPRAELIFER